MKHVFNLAIVLMALNTTVMAQKGFTVEKELTINVPASELWEMIGPGFVEVYKWSSNVDHAEGSGQGQFKGAVCDERSCNVNVKGFSSISEKLTKYDEKNMSLAYVVQEGMPSFVTLAKNDWTVVPVSKGTSKLVMQAEFGSKGLMGAMTRGMMQRQMSKTLETILNDAKVYAETGEVSVAKAERIKELQSKKKAA